MTVLIVEDDEAYAYALSKALEVAGLNPVRCDSWTDYLDRIESDEKVHSAILDVRLPPGTPNGHSLARMSYIKRPGLKLLVVSSDPELLYDLPPEATALPKSASLGEITSAISAR